LSMDEFVSLTAEEWRKKLSEPEFRVLRESGTERPFSSDFHAPGHEGLFACKGCGAELFASTSQFDSGCGWPSFDQGVDEGSITEHLDRSHGMVRVEVRCGRCDSHLGHVFPDGPTETGNRYCINGICLIPVSR